MSNWQELDPTKEVEDFYNLVTKQRDALIRLANYQRSEEKST